MYVCIFQTGPASVLRKNAIEFTRPQDSEEQTTSSEDLYEQTSAERNVPSAPKWLKTEVC